MNENNQPSGWHDTNATKPADERQTRSEKNKDQIEAMGEDAKQQAEKFGETAKKFAQEAGYAAAGFAGLMGDKAKAFYEEQKEQYAETHPDQDKDPGAKEFLEQLSDKLNKLVDDLASGFKDMADRGRDTWKSDGDDTQTAAQEDVTDVAGGDLQEDPVDDGTATGVADDERKDL